MELDKYPVLQSASLAGCSARRRWWVCWGTPRWSPASKTSLISRQRDTSFDRNGSSVATDDWQTNKPTLESIVRIKRPCSEELISDVRHDERQWRQWTMENSIEVLELTLCTNINMLGWVNWEINTMMKLQQEQEKETKHWVSWKTLDEHIGYPVKVKHEVRMNHAR